MRIDEVSSRVKETLEEWEALADVPIVPEELPGTVAAFGGVEVKSYEQLQELQERALNEQGILITVLSLAAGTLVNVTRAEKSRVTVEQILAISANLQASNGSGPAALTVLRETIRALRGRATGRGRPEFRLAPEAFARADGGAGVMTYFVGFEVDVTID